MIDEPSGEERRLRIALIRDEPPVHDAGRERSRPDDLAAALERHGHVVDVLTSAQCRGRDISGYDVVHAFGTASVPWRWRGPVRIRTLDAHPFRGVRRARSWRNRTRIAADGLSRLWASATAATVVTRPEAGAGVPWLNTVVPVGVDRAVFAPGTAAKPPAPVVLFVGSWSGSDRGAELAWLFVRTVARRVPGAELRMITPDDAVGAPEGVVLLGRLEPAELLDEYRRAWVFCVPSEVGESAALLEAMSMGLPVVATPTDQSRSITRDGIDGVLVGFAGIPDVLVSLLTSAPARHRMSQLALERSHAYDFETIAERYEQVYRTRGRLPRAHSALRRMRQD